MEIFFDTEVKLLFSTVSTVHVLKDVHFMTMFLIQRLKYKIFNNGHQATNATVYNSKLSILF